MLSKAGPAVGGRGPVTKPQNERLAAEKWFGLTPFQEVILMPLGVDCRSGRNGSKVAV